MICPHPRLGEEEEGEQERAGLDLWDGSGDEVGEIADKRLTTEDNVGSLID